MSKWVSNPNISLNSTPNPNGTVPIFINLPIGHIAVHTFCAVFVPIVCALGFLGNALAFILLKESAKKVSSHFYLCCLAIADSVTLVTIMTSIWFGVVMQGYYYVTNQFTEDNWVRVGTGICWFSQLRIYISFLCRMVSVWLVVVLSVERCISVLSPLKWGTRLCTVRNGIRAVVALCVVSALLNIYVIFGFERKQVGKQHRCVPNFHFYIGRVAGNAVLSVVPWIIICISNGLLVVVMRKRNRRSGSGHQGIRQERQERSITVRLLTISMAFLAFTLPNTILGTIHTVHEMQKSTAHKHGILADLWLLAFALFACNFACNFVLYCLTGKNFRRAAVALLLCRMQRMGKLREKLDVDSSQSGGTAQILRSDSGSTPTNVTVLSREPSDLSSTNRNQQLESKQRLLRKETRI